MFQSSKDSFSSISATWSSTAIVESSNSASALIPSADQNLEGITLIWFDSSIGSNEDTKQTQKELREINNFIVFPTEEQAAVNYIKSITKEKIFLVTSGHCASSILSLVEHMQQVDSVFIFCLKVEKYKHLTNKFTKIVGIYCNRCDLMHSIRESIGRAERQHQVFTVYKQHGEKATRDLSKESADFLWFQLFKDVILRMPKDAQAKEQMVQFCRDYYHDNNKQLSLIDEFQQDYVASDAIKWYTKESFVYRLVNKALRTEDIEQLYTFRFFISDLSIQLAIQHQKLKTQEEYILLYRGHRMQLNELHILKENAGSLIATNGYLSTTRSTKVAMDFATNGTSTRSNIASVLYEIQCNLQEVKSIALADISALSQYSAEEEILIDIGATFKIVSVKEDIDQKLWIVQLRTTDKGTILAHEYIELNKKEGNCTLLFGKLLTTMGKYDQALKYFQNLLKNLPEVGAEVADVYNQMGKVYRLNGKFEEAMQNYQRAYDLTLTSHPFRIKEAAKALNNIAIIFRKRCQYDRALELHFQALKTKEEYYGKDHLETAKTLRNIGSVYDAKQQYDHALEYYQHCLRIQQKHLPTDHIDIAMTLQNIGKVYRDMNYNDIALEHFQASLKMRQKLLLSDHNDIATSLVYIASVYSNQGQYHIALNNFFRALEIQRKAFDTNDGHPDIAETLQYIGVLHEKLSNYSTAIEFYNQALDMNKKLLPPDHPTITKLYNNVDILRNILEPDNCWLKYSPSHLQNSYD
ncbi:unnamed protein product [Rotaria sp. Silwood1]|nr:unnamed protein product [Rotaria sp. Silwood1]